MFLDCLRLSHSTLCPDVEKHTVLTLHLCWLQIEPLAYGCSSHQFMISSAYLKAVLPAPIARHFLSLAP